MPTWLADACRHPRHPRRLLLIGDHTLPPGSETDYADLPLTVERIEVEPGGPVDAAALAAPLGADPRFGQTPHLLIAGRAPPAEALLLHALHLAQYGEEPPLITVLDADPAPWRQGFEARYPQAGEVGRVRFRPIEDPGLAHTAPVTLVIVCLADADRAIGLGCRLIEQIGRVQQASPPALVEIGDGRRPTGNLADWDGQLIPISHRRLALEPAGLLDGRGDALAEVIHEHYRDTTEAQGRDPAEGPAGRPWATLGSAYRDANRHQADHLWIKLALTDCRAVGEDQADAFAFTPPEVERLAVVEHRRWAADRWLAGWTYAPVRDNAAKHHPQLVAFAALSGPMQDLDRFAVRLLPTLLARPGLGLQRMLIVGLDEPDQPASPPPRLIRRLLQRLSARYPDRSLVIAGTLSHPAQRLIANMALQQTQAMLMLLCPRPLAATLAAQPDAEQRRDLLGLVAQAERRIPLAGPGALEHWLAERAEIRVRLATGPPSPVGKQIHIDTAATRLHWGFEY